MDFWPIDVVHLPLVHIRTGPELGAQGRKGKADLRRGGILPPKGIYARLTDKLKPCNNVVGVHARENLPEHRQRKGLFLNHTTIGKTFSMGHPMSSSKPLQEWCVGGQARKSLGPYMKKKKQKKGKQDQMERNGRSGNFFF